MSDETVVWWATSVAFGTGFGLGSMVGWGISDLLRRVLRWYWERRS